ncbi:MAG: hypothetical protein R3C18_09120 [Planctomycetaceae bacterium]
MSTRDRLLTWCGLLLALLIVLRPVNSPELWWHLSCGREVIDGTFSPSQQLLLLDQSADSNWGGGLVFYVIWSIGGMFALATWPIVAALGLLWLVRKKVPADWSLLQSFTLLAVALVAIRPGLQPVPAVFDLVGLLCMPLIERQCQSSRSRLIATFLLGAAWATLGPRPLWGLLWLLLQFGKTPETTKPEASPLGSVMALLLGGCLTPRGIWTWYDALVNTVPTVFDSGQIGDSQAWSTLSLLSSFPVEAWALLVLLVAALVQLFRTAKRVVPELASVFVPLLLALICRDNVPLAACWISMWYLQLSSQIKVGTSSSSANDESKGSRESPVSLWGWRLAFSGTVGLLLVDASGLLTAPGQRLGWGIAQEIDPRLLDLPDNSRDEEPLIAWVPDERSAGLVVWQDVGVVLVDHPRRAVLSGRLPMHRQFARDLQEARRAQYRLENGEWAGWVVQATEWKLQLLCVPVEDEPLNTSLTKSTWQRVDLDSPTIPYASTDTQKFAAAVSLTLQLQGFVETGPWRPDKSVYDSMGWRYDVIELLGMGPEPGPAVRQSQAFRSLDLPFAGLRALNVVRGESSHPALQREFTRCQEAMAYQEWTTFGAAGEFRRHVVQSVMNGKQESSPWLQSYEDDEPIERWEPALSLYLAGDTEAARDALKSNQPQAIYARAMLALEVGDTRRALREFDVLLDDDTANLPPGLHVAAQFWSNQIGQLEQ